MEENVRDPKELKNDGGLDIVIRFLQESNSRIALITFDNRKSAEAFNG